MRHNKTAEIMEKYATKRRLAELEGERRELEIHGKIPETLEIDRELRGTALKILNISASGVDIDEKMNGLRDRISKLQKRRADLLTAAGYPADYTDAKYECPKCFDTGFVGTDVCECLRRELAYAALEDSGIGNLAETESFENFDFSYYSDDDLTMMRRNFNILRNFADNFDPKKPQNFLLMGATGLGKTHLSTAVAKTVIEHGFKVVYDTIDGILSDFDAERFKGTVDEAEIEKRFYESDLLIIDDLGCEVSNRFSVSCVYNLINTRINRNKSTIINTNLSFEELRDCYADRITSRIFGEFQPLLFTGRDVRRQKIEKYK